MVTVHRAFGFQFVVFANDHAPPHIHMFGQGGEAKIDLLEDPIVTWVNGISRADLRRCLAEVREHRLVLLEGWRKLHG